jgi:hypothetical protein
MKKRQSSLLVGAFLMSSFVATSLTAAPITVPGTTTGTLASQGTPLLETFSLASTTVLTVTSTSYATGGFQPNLFLFNSTGNEVAVGSPFGVADPTTHIIGDSRISALVPAGSYTLAITDFLLNQSLTSTKLSAGFTQNYGDGATFQDADGNTRTGAFSITVTASAVPEPTTLWLSATCLAALAIKSKNIFGIKSNSTEEKQ